MERAGTGDIRAVRAFPVSIIGRAVTCKASQAGSVIIGKIIPSFNNIILSQRASCPAVSAHIRTSVASAGEAIRTNIIIDDSVIGSRPPAAALKIVKAAVAG